jgi:hypothetical protein
MGLGRRTFAPGEVLTASNVMNYLQDQAVMNFAGTAARGSAIGTAVAEGMVSYLNDTDSLEVYRAVGTAAPAWTPVAFESFVDNKFGSTGIPFRQAAGIATGNATANANSNGWFWNQATTVTLPVGRFTQAPVVTITYNSVDTVGFSVMQGSQPSTTSFSFFHLRLAAYPPAYTTHWHAVQMTTGSGSG